MLSLLIAALVAATPVHTSTHHTDVINSEKTVEDIAADRSNYCQGVLSGKVSPEQAFADLELNTVAKRTEFEIDCQVFLDGVGVGVMITDEKKDGPDASKGINP